MPSVSERFSRRLIAARTPLLALAAVLAAGSAWVAKDLTFDRSVENMFAPDDPLLGPYRRLRRTFGGNEVVLAVYNDPKLLSSDGSGIDRLAEVSRQLATVPGVQSVLSLDRLMGRMIVDPNNELAARQRKLFEGYTHSADGQVAALSCMLIPDSKTDVSRRLTIAMLREKISALPSGMIAGEPVMVVDGFRFVEADGRRLGWASMILLAIVIVLSFRSLRWVIVPLAIVQLTLVMTQAILVLSSLRLSMVSSMLTAIVTVVGIATVVHLIVGFREARQRGLEPASALAAAGALLAAPIFWSCLTDAVGFLSLLVSHVGPVQHFGTMMAIGSVVVLWSVVLLVPGLALMGRIDADPRRAWGEGHLDYQLHQMILWVEHRPRTIAVTTLALAALATAGISRLEVETDFTRNFRANSPIVESYAFVESRLGGAGVWDVLVPAPDALDWDYLQKVSRLEDRLRGEVQVVGANGQPQPALTKVISLADAVKAGAPANLATMRPFIRQTLIGTGLTLMQSGLPAFYAALYAEDPQHPGQWWFRIMLRSHERQSSAAKRSIIDQVRRISSEEFPEAEVTGYFVLLTHLIDSILGDQWYTFAVATLGIGVMMLVAVRNPVLTLIALVPNAVPILVVMGLMGWLGFRINMGAAMIAAVSMGLSIDSSIHYLTSYRRARAQGLTLHEALSAVQQTVGRALCYATLALIVGFAVLCTSQFVPTIYFGALVSLAMLGGLAGNLVVLPLLLRLTAR